MLVSEKYLGKFRTIDIDTVTLQANEKFRQDTIEKIRIYIYLLTEWNKKMNFVQSETIRDAYNRHICDSTQIIPIIQEEQKIGHNKSFFDSNGFEALVREQNPIHILDSMNYRYDDLKSDIKKISIIDVGTGAGFPGMILAICGFENITLCDINQKKCLFLEEVARQTNTKVTVLNQDVGDIASRYEIIISRAYASLDVLLNVTQRLSMNDETYGIFHKGKTWNGEISDACKKWEFRPHVYESMTSKEGVILVCKSINQKNIN